MPNLCISDYLTKAKKDRLSARGLDIGYIPSGGNGKESQAIPTMAWSLPSCEAT